MSLVYWLLFLLLAVSWITTSCLGNEQGFSSKSLELWPILMLSLSLFACRCVCLCLCGKQISNVFAGLSDALLIFRSSNNSANATFL